MASSLTGSDSVTTRTFSVLDYVVFAAMLCVSSGIGIYYAWKDRKKQSNREFLTANRQLGVFPVAMSLLASFQSSVTILGYPAEMFARGTQFWVVIISGAIAVLLSAEIFLPIFYRMKMTSVNEYLEQRFNSKIVRLAGSVSFLLSTVPYMGVVLYGPSLALGSVTELSVSSSILIIGIICTFYTTIGGIKAVVWTDVIQVFLMFAGLLAVLIQGSLRVGGLTEAWRIADEGGRIQFTNFHVDLYSSANFWNAVLGMGVVWTGLYCTSQTQTQRYCSVASVTRAKVALYANLAGLAVLISIACLCGVAIYANYYNCDPLQLGYIGKPDQLMPYFVMEALGHIPGLPGLFVACVFSASLSTLSSGFNSLAAVTWDDFVRHCLPLGDKHASWLTKATAAGYGLIAIGMAFLVGRIGSVLTAAVSLSGALVGPMLGTFILGALCPLCNDKGVLMGLFVGQSFTLWVTGGSIVYPKVPDAMPTSTDGCLLPNSTDIPVSSMWTNASTIQPMDVTFAQDKGLDRLYHITFLLVPVAGLVLSLIVGFLGSLVTGANKGREIDHRLLNPTALRLWRACLPKSYLILEPQEVYLENSVARASDGFKKVPSENGYHEPQYEVRLTSTDGGDPQLSTQM